MIAVLIAAALTVVLADLAERMVAPAALKREGTVPRALLVLAGFGVVLAVTGGAFLSVMAVDLLVLLLLVVSILKARALGEPLVMTDLAVAASFLRYPRFYLAAVPWPARFAMPLCAVLMLLVALRGVSGAWRPHAEGCVLALAATVALWWLWRVRWRDRLMTTPDIRRDRARFGILLTLAVYTMRWRATVDPTPLSPVVPWSAGSPPLVVIVQCESFADPTTLVPGHPRPALPALERLRRQADRHGALAVSGFGAYTMRTEYGVLVGRDEASLGFRACDPFLTARGEASFALPRRLGGVYAHRVFVHPHDLRFYDRERLMPALGFTTLVSPEAFSASVAHGPYIGDRALGRYLCDRVTAAREPELIYAVTMENHGPWSAGRVGAADGLGAWEAHAHNSDALLDMLDTALVAAQRPALLVFFGDHRPSLPGVTDPGGDRETPFVLRAYRPGREDRDVAVPAECLSPAGLHRAIIEAIDEFRVGNRENP
ncbi:capsule polysaccharide biosynthesis protein [Ameyamaea chiangmaiensis NBRC 103196]|nr:capsule polysaccharide biosynthesis protein [Ameyamaea chiangmaiensis NBRC 103196]